MRRRNLLLTIALIRFAVFATAASFAADNTEEARPNAAIAYDCEVVPLERNGVKLHLERVALADATPQKEILLVHGVTYSSHEFDVDYEDYSLIRRLAREGYGAWRLDIAGFGLSDSVEDGFATDTEYAALDIEAAVEKIVRKTGRGTIDVLGWSWGTTTVALYAARRPERVDKLVLYAPILSGVGEFEVDEPFHRNSWEHAVEDFQRGANGELDAALTDPIVVALYASNCWRFDGETSPNGGRRDVCVSMKTKLIDFTRVVAPTLIICGDKDPYLNWELIADATAFLPKGSKLEVIEGGAHAVFLEKPFHRDFQERLIRFLKSESR